MIKTIKILAVAALLTGCQKEEPRKKDYKVTYIVNCKSCIVVYEDANKIVKSNQNVTNQFSYQYYATEGNHMHINAANKATTGSVEVIIYKDQNVSLKKHEKTKKAIFYKI